MPNHSPGIRALGRSTGGCVGELHEPLVPGWDVVDLLLLECERHDDPKQAGRPLWQCLYFSLVALRAKGYQRGSERVVGLKRLGRRIYSDNSLNRAARCSRFVLRIFQGEIPDAGRRVEG